MIAKVRSFFLEARQESQRVNWPTLAETVRLTFMVVVMSLMVAAFLGFLDFLFTYGLTQLITYYQYY